MRQVGGICLQKQWQKRFVLLFRLAYAQFATEFQSCSSQAITTKVLLVYSSPTNSKNNCSSDLSLSSACKNSRNSGTVPTKRIFPFAIIPIRSQTFSATSKTCVEKNTVLPLSACSRIISFITKEECGSKPVIGSSKIQLFGS